MVKINNRMVFLAPLVAVALPAVAGAHEPGNWEIGVVLDAAHTSKKLELGARGKDLELGHSDLVIRGPLGKAFTAEYSLAAHTDEGKLEHHTENLWIQTRTLPAGLQAKLGRFSSQISYLNEQHPHADDFTERPLLYRGFLGGHWYDDGLRLNWTAPTPFYLRFGVEAFSGKQLIKEAETKKSPGAQTFSMKTGGDFNASNSWQFGLSYLNNRRQAEVHEHDEEHGHDHAHGAEFSGKHMWMTDLVYKWAPNGDSKNQQVRLIWEHARVSGIHPESGSLRHSGSSLAAIYRFHPSWEIGARTDWLKVNKPELHDDDPRPPQLEFGSGRLRETALMIAYKPNHMQTYRLQWSRQTATGGDEPVFANPVKNSIQFQVVIGFGAHGAHSY
jgi:hypothetical protein